MHHSFDVHGALRVSRFAAKTPCRRLMYCVICAVLQWSKFESDIVGFSGSTLPKKTIRCPGRTTYPRPVGTSYADTGQTSSLILSVCPQISNIFRRFVFIFSQERARFRRLADFGYSNSKILALLVCGLTWESVGGRNDTNMIVHNHCRKFVLRMTNPGYSLCTGCAMPAE